MFQPLHDVTYVNPEPHKMTIAVRFGDKPSAKDILRRVCSVFDVEKSDILRDVRHREAVRARWVAMYAIQHILGYSYPQIGRIMGKDHTTVMHGIKTTKAIMAGEMHGKYGYDFVGKVEQILLGVYI